MNVGKKTLSSALLGAVVIVTPFIAQKEGFEEKPYYDIAGVLTDCFGETEGVNLKIHRSYSTCFDLLQIRTNQFAVDVYSNMNREPTPNQLAAFTSLSYNIGISAFKNSTALRRFNYGDDVGACDAIKMWNKICMVEAGKKNCRTVQGLVNRREAERSMCLEGL